MFRNKVIIYRYERASTTRGHSSLWRHNGRYGVSNHQPHECLLNYSFKRRSKKTWKLRITGLCAGNSPVRPVNSPHKWPVKRKMFPFDDVIILFKYYFTLCRVLMWFRNTGNWFCSFPRIRFLSEPVLLRNISEYLTSQHPRHALNRRRS